jgi:hypothetical protein
MQLTRTDGDLDTSRRKDDVASASQYPESAGVGGLARR